MMFIKLKQAIGEKFVQLQEFGKSDLKPLEKSKTGVE